MKQPVTQNQVDAVKEILFCIHSTIKEAGNQGVPAGHLYAALMQHMTLETFTLVMAALVKAGKVVQKGFVYTAK